MFFTPELQHQCQSCGWILVLKMAATVPLLQPMACSSGCGVKNLRLKNSPEFVTSQYTKQSTKVSVPLVKLTAG